MAAWSEGEGWRVSRTSSLDLRAAGSGPAHEFRRVVGAARLDDGRLAVADAGSGEVRYYSPEGAFLSAWRDEAASVEGDLTSLSRLGGDSLVVFDAARAAATVLSPAGSAVRVVPLRWTGDSPLARAFALRDGTLIVRTGWSASASRGLGPGVVRAPLAFLRFAADGVLLDTVAVVPGNAVAVVPLGPAGAFLPPVLGAVTVSDVRGQELIVGTGDAFELRVIAADGRLEEILRVPSADLAVTPEELEAARASLTRLGEENPVARRILAEVGRWAPDPDTRPAYGALVVDREGYAWVAEYPWGGPGAVPARQPVAWTVFDAEGRMLGEVRIPEGLELLEVGRDYVLGVHRLDGVETVASYALDRGGG